MLRTESRIDVVASLLFHSVLSPQHSVLPSPGGFFSVALSVGLLRLDVIKHRAFRKGGKPLNRSSSDFPHLSHKDDRRDHHCDRDAGIIHEKIMLNLDA